MCSYSCTGAHSGFLLTINFELIENIWVTPNKDLREVIFLRQEINLIKMIA